MQSLATIREKSQESLTYLVQAGKQQPPAVKLWGVVAASAVVGGGVVAVGAKGILSVVGLLASPPVALTIGALAGGALGWSFMQDQSDNATEQLATAPVTADSTDAATPVAA